MENCKNKQLNIGDIVLATITKIEKKYIKMSLGNVFAVMPASEYSWQKSDNIKSKLQVGESIKAVVIAMKDGIVMLSVKRMKIDPWKSVDETYRTGMRVRGRINKILSYGAFVELDNGIQGLLHRSNVIKNSQIDIRTIISENQEIEVDIISINKNERKISLSIIMN